MKKQIALLFFLLLIGVAQAQRKSEIINKTASFKNQLATNVLSVENIHGGVKIEAYNGDKVILEAEKTITASNAQEVEKGMQEVQLVLKESGDSIYFYLEAPFITRKKGNSPNISINRNEAKYHFNFNITVKVPRKTNLYVATINNGDVEVNGIVGDIKAHNVNGGIKLTSVTGKTDANTVNGPINITYSTNPPAHSKYKTINGEIRVAYAPKLDAAISFKTMNGQFYTDIPDLELLPVKLVKNTSKSGGGTIYKIDKNQTYKVGKGTIELAFETLNGNIYLKKN